MIDGFEFEEGGRKYVCRVEKQPGHSAEAWWWFSVSGDSARYAPFQAASGDTRSSVAARIVAYHTNRLARRAAPPEVQKQW